MTSVGIISQMGAPGGREDDFHAWYEGKPERLAVHEIDDVGALELPTDRRAHVLLRARNRLRVRRHRRPPRRG